MFTRFVAAALGAALVFSSPARAGETAPPPGAAMTRPEVCAAAPREQFKSEAELRSAVENFLRYRVTRVSIDGGCYSVVALDRSGNVFEVKFRGDDLRMVSRYVVKNVPLNPLSSSQ